ncbi:hypothetical protein [Glutamicibacter nicotianae]|uniref:hypothetical protein n=1 Tax=Glutamicibacter nicotianae TaxID=37929 RepID=UPI00167F42D5|nr:hypothetical protein [Glutamicibacter nicotianae]
MTTDLLLPLLIAVGVSVVSVVIVPFLTTAFTNWRANKAAALQRRRDAATALIAAAYALQAESTTKSRIPVPEAQELEKDFTVRIALNSASGQILLLTKRDIPELAEFLRSLRWHCSRHTGDWETHLPAVLGAWIPKGKPARRRTSWHSLNSITALPDLDSIAKSNGEG